jgi:hypothetical protein
MDSQRRRRLRLSAHELVGGNGDLTPNYRRMRRHDGTGSPDKLAVAEVLRRAIERLRDRPEEVAAVLEGRPLRLQIVITGDGSLEFTMLFSRDGHVVCPAAVEDVDVVVEMPPVEAAELLAGTLPLDMLAERGGLVAREPSLVVYRLAALFELLGRHGRDDRPERRARAVVGTAVSRWKPGLLRPKLVPSLALAALPIAITGAVTTYAPAAATPRVLTARPALATTTTVGDRVSRVATGAQRQGTRRTTAATPNPGRAQVPRPPVVIGPRGATVDTTATHPAGALNEHGGLELRCNGVVGSAACAATGVVAAWVPGP